MTLCTETPDLLYNPSGDELVAWIKGADDDAEDQPTTPGYFYVVAVEQTQSYGGPEEGGWWYTISKPLAAVPIRWPGETPSQLVLQALDAHAKLVADLSPAYQDRRPASSATGDGADLNVHLARGFPTVKPQTRPHYE